MPEAAIYQPDPREPTALASDLPGGDLGGGAGGWQEVFIDRDPSPPDVTAKPAVNARSDGGSWTKWDPGTQGWA